MSIYSKMILVQANIKAIKGQYNSFGKYNYRSCEDIVEAAKPILAENGLVLSMSDDVVIVGDRYYVKATATVIDAETGEKHSVTASAREEENKKGMDGSQVTGASSSYARKYALNGLFAIDDTKDSDKSNEPKEKKLGEDSQVKLEKPQLITPDQAIEVNDDCANHGKDIRKMLDYFKLKTLQDMTVSQYDQFKKLIEKENRK